MKRVVAHGTFDILHFGHLNYLEKSLSFGNYLIVLVTSDKETSRHGKNPYFNEDIRLRMINALKIVDEGIIRDEKITLDLLKRLNANVFVTTDKELAKNLTNSDNIKIVVLDRTKGISTSKIKEDCI